MVSPFRIGSTVNPRRLSVNDSFRDVEGNIRRAISRLNELWDQIHMSESMRVSRVQTAFGHISKLLYDMVESEEEMVARVGTSIENGQNEVNSIRAQLGMEQWENKKAPPGSIELRNAIESELMKLKPIFEERREQQRNLIERLEQLSFRLGLQEVLPFLGEGNELVPEDKFNALEARSLQLEDMLQKRLKKAQLWQKEMSKFLKKLGRKVLSDDEDGRELRLILDLDFSSEDTSLTDASMDTMEKHYNQLREMYSEYVQEQEFRWLEMYEELSELWEKCHVADIERMIPPSYDPGKHDEKDFEKIATEISRLKSLYEARKDVFEALKNWKDKWAEKIALEDKKKCPEYFQNRGRENNVYLDAKIERTLNEFTLPKLVKKVICVYEEYRRSHPCDEIRVDGFTPPDYVKMVVDEYNAAKEVERKIRQKQRMASTSSLRSAASTPRGQCTKTPRKLHVTQSSSKIEPLRKRLRYDTTLSPCFNSTNCSIPSVITPTRRHKDGPKHSSPKFSTPKMGSARKRTPRSGLKSTPRDKRSPFKPTNKHV